MSTPKSSASPTTRDTHPNRDAHALGFSQQSSIVSRIDSVAYELFGDFFTSHEDWFETIDKQLDQARYPINYDIYLSRIAFITFITLFFTTFLGIPVAASLAVSPVPNVLFPFSGLLNRTLTFGIFWIVPIALVVASGIAYPYVRLQLVTSGRARRIDQSLPFATTYLYALSRGGMNFIDAMRTLANSEDAYGEVSIETQSVIRDMDYLSVDLPRAMRRGAKRTPSDKFAEFMDDLVAVVDSGADISTFLESKSEDFLEQDEREQENFIQTLSLLGEVYVTAFVAGPLFLIIITVVMSMLGGGSSLRQMYGIVYALLPIMNIAFYLLIDTITIDEQKLNRTIDTEREQRTIEEVREKFAQHTSNENNIDTIIKSKDFRDRSESLRHPIKWMLDNPLRTLVISGPLTAAYLLGILISQVIPLTLTSFNTMPVETTFLYILGPIFVLLTPYMIAYEISSRRKKKMLNRFPDALKQLASSNSIGLPLTEALQTTADSTSGPLGDEIQKVSQDIIWYNNITEALVAFANRVKVPEVARSVKLITKANEASGDIAEVLDIAAKDVKNRQILRDQRFSEMVMYTAVIIISYGVYLFVIVMLDSAFLSEIAAIQQSTSNQGTGASQQFSGGGSGFGNLSDIPIQKFKMVFYHSTLIQAFGSGLLAGHLGNNDIRSGIKFAIILSTISTLVFFYV